MELVQSANVDTSKFLALDESKASATNPKWRCSDFTLKMLEDGAYADITLRAKGGSVKAHKSVLTCVSPVFNAMFQDDMKEHLTSTVDIPDMTIDALQLFLLMLYTTNEAGNENIDVSSHQMPHFSAAIDKHFREIYKVVLKYQVDSRLGSVLISALARNLTPENCWYYYVDSSLVTAPRLFGSCAVSVCLYYVLGNYHDVIKSMSFVKEMGCNSHLVHGVIMRAESRATRKSALQNFLRIKRL